MPNDGSQISPDGSGKASTSNSGQVGTNGASSPADTDSFVETPGQVWVAKTELKPGAVGLTGAVMQNVTHIAPAIAAFFFTATIVGYAGGHAPLAYLLGFIIVLALGMCLVQLAKKFPSAGQSFTYGSRPVGPRAGVLTGGLSVVFSPQVARPGLAALPLVFGGGIPRRNVPRATMASIVIIGVMLVVVIWGQVIGWGVNNLSKLPTSPELPALVIAHRVWGAVWWFALIAMFTSVFGASLACQNVATRMWFGMGRSGVLPAAFGRVHPVRKTPTAAVTMPLVLSAVLGVVGGWWL